MNAEISSRFVFIDALRGVAAIWVLVHHFRHNGRFEMRFDELFGGTLPDAVDKFFAWGTAGVEVFFLLSGLMIAHCLYRRDVSLIGMTRFSGRRLTRLLLPYWLALALALVITVINIVLHPEGVAKPIQLGALITNLTLTYPYTGSPSYLPVAWTLIVEIQFYLFFVLLAFIANKCARHPEESTRILITLTLLTGTVSVVWSTMRGYHAFNNHILSYWLFFVIGAGCYWFYRKEIHLTVCLFVVAFAAAAAIYLWSPRMLIGVFAGVLLVGAVYFDGVKIWLGGPVTQYLGGRSYSIYLIHFPILTMCNIWFFQNEKSSVSIYIAAQLVALAIALALSELSYRIVEIPAINLSHKFKGLQHLKVRSPESNRIFNSRRTSEELACVGD